MIFVMLSSNSIRSSIECILKFIFKVRIKANMDLCNIWTNISEMVHAMTGHD